MLIQTKKLILLKTHYAAGSLQITNLMLNVNYISHKSMSLHIDAKTNKLVLWWIHRHATNLSSSPKGLMGNNCFDSFIVYGEEHQTADGELMLFRHPSLCVCGLFMKNTTHRVQETDANETNQSNCFPLLNTDHVLHSLLLSGPGFSSGSLRL